MDPNNLPGLMAGIGLVFSLAAVPLGACAWYFSDNKKDGVTGNFLAGMAIGCLLAAGVCQFVAWMAI